LRTAGSELVSATCSSSGIASSLGTLTDEGQVPKSR
jgi:hypothetical protein